MATSSYYSFDCFLEDVFEGKHNFASDTLAVHLSANANGAPSASGDTIESELPTEITTTYLINDTPTVSSSAQSGGTYTLVLNDTVLEASGGSVGPFRYVTLINETATDNPVIMYYDYGADLTLSDGETLTIEWGASYLLQVSYT